MNYFCWIGFAVQVGLLKLPNLRLSSKRLSVSTFFQAALIAGRHCASIFL